MKWLIASGMAALAVAAGLRVAPSGSRTAFAATQNVSVQDFQFVDATSMNSTTTITAGDTVHWTWTGAAPHSVTADGGAFDEPAGSSKTTGTFDMTFNTPGTYRYYCRIHGGAGGVGMSGTIVVNAAPAPPTATNTAAPTNTPAATHTPGASPSSAAATSTPVAASSTPVAAATATASSPTRAAASPTQAGAAGAGASLPRTGTGATGGGGAPVWLSAILAAAGFVLLSGAGALKLRRSRA